MGKQASCAGSPLRVHINARTLERLVERGNILPELVPSSSGPQRTLKVDLHVTAKGKTFRKVYNVRNVFWKKQKKP
jgi:hypothetical protein